MELQEEVRCYLVKYGIKKKHIASLIGIYPCNLSQWLAGKYELNPEQTQKIKELVKVHLCI